MIRAMHEEHSEKTGQKTAPGNAAPDVAARTPLPENAAVVESCAEAARLLDECEERALVATGSSHGLSILRTVVAVPAARQVSSSVRSPPN